MNKEIEKALAFVKEKEASDASIFIRKINNVGELQEETECYTYSHLYEWLQKFPKYFRSFSPNSGRILVGHCLYRLEL